MSDVFTKAKRSRIMSAIRSTGNKDTELRLATIFRRHSIKGWRRHQAVFGSPDFVFRRQKLAVFVDGCFWHGCRQHCRKPKTNRKYWQSKIARNKARDRLVNRLLRAEGWKIVRIWGHTLASPEKVIAKINSVLNPAPALCNDFTR